MSVIKLDPLCGLPITDEALKRDLEALRKQEITLHVRMLTARTGLRAIRRKMAEIQAVLTVAEVGV